MKCQDLYKIGKAINVENRLNEFKCSNPFIEHVKTIEGDYERYLHRYYKSKRVVREWFKLNQLEIDSIEQIIKNIDPKVYSTITKENYIKCPCQDQFEKAILAVHYIVGLRNYSTITNKARETRNYDYQIWADNLIVDECKSGKEEFLKLSIIEIKEKPKEDPIAE